MRPSYHLPKGGTQTGSGIWLGRVVALVFGTIAPIWAATEYIAWCFAWHPHLGFRWFGYIYYPWAIIPWWWYNRHITGTGDWWEHALWIISLAHLAEFIAIALVVRRARQFGGKSDLHGSAQWATDKDVKKSGLWQQKEGVYIGGWNDGSQFHYLRHNGPQNVLAFAPGRSGKGVGLVIPTLNSWTHNAIVYDVKRENWHLSAGWRQKEMGSICIEFNPTCNDGSSARCNPLLWTRKWPHDVRDVQLLAEVLTNPSGDPQDARYAEESHWKLAAQDLIVGIILHQLYAGENKTLNGCLAVLDGEGKQVEKKFAGMMKTVHDPAGQYGWGNNTHPAVAGAMRAILNKADNERSGVISTAAKFFNLYRDKIIADNTATCDFEIEDLMGKEKPVSLYLTTPPSDLDRTRPLMRLILMLITKRLVEKMKQYDGANKNRLLLMLDEFPQLGRLEFLHSALSYMPGYGIKTYIVVQDVGQIHQLYGQNESLTTSCHIKIGFTPNTIETARTMSDMLGTMTVIKDANTYTGSRFSLLLRNVISSEQETQRPLMTADELLQMPESDAIVFSGGQRPIYGAKIPYYLDSEFLRRSQIPAPSQSDRLPFTSPWTYVASQETEKEVIEVTTREVTPLEQEMEGLL